MYISNHNLIITNQNKNEMKNKLTNREMDFSYFMLSKNENLYWPNLLYAEAMIRRAYWEKKYGPSFWRENRIKEYRNYRNYLYPIFTSFIKEGHYRPEFMHEIIKWIVLEESFITSFTAYEHLYIRNQKLSKIKNELNRKTTIDNIV